MDLSPKTDLSSTVGAFPGEEELLGEAGGGAVVDSAEVSHLGEAPTFEAVAAGHGLDHPGVDREGGVMVEPKEEHAVGDFFPDAR